jgi:hypothetical protein
MTNAGHVASIVIYAPNLKFRKMVCSSNQRKQRSKEAESIFIKEESGELRMKTSLNTSPQGKTPSQEIDAIIKEAGDWRGMKLAQLRALIKKADAAVVEEVKWKKPSKPSGVPVWSYDGIICVADILKNAVRLTFPKGTQVKDSKKLFNTRLDSKTVRAIDFHEDDIVNEAALKTLILNAVKVNMAKESK